MNKEGLELELGPPPVPSLGVVSNRVADPHPDPLNFYIIFYLIPYIQIKSLRIRNSLIFRSFSIRINSINLKIFSVLFIYLLNKF